MIIIDEIIVEYIILGKVSLRRYLPFFSYILCISESLKNNTFIKINKTKCIKNKHNFIAFEL